MSSSAWCPPATILAPGSGVVVMSARPGCIKLDRVVDQPHPRHCAMKTAPAFTEPKTGLAGQVRSKVIAAQALQTA
ncbi:MAG: hypothetical protein KF683_12800 [Rubrivivax sp.]|nr:hypothetical protein [Rubrivivax sp.]